MASQCQIEADRRNAQKCSAQLHTGDNHDFDKFRAGFIAEHQPSTPTELFLVDQMASAAWRLRRLRAAESGYWELIMSKFEEDPKACNSAMSNLNRYEARLEGAFYKALRELERLRSERAEEPQPIEPPRPSPEIGFVSPSEPETPPIPLPAGTDEEIPPGLPAQMLAIGPVPE
jgi:hypothetical protein